MTAPSNQTQLRKRFPFVSAQAQNALIERGLLSFPEPRKNWRFGDRANGTTRALDGKKFVRSDNKGADWHKLIGLADVIEHDRRFVMFVLEGSTDATCRV
jgi:hypothetical protein